MADFTKRPDGNWQDGLMMVLGLVLIGAPWIFGFAAIPAAMWNAVIFGVVLCAMALAALTRFHDWEEWADMAVGLWLMISPWALGFFAYRTGETAMAGAMAATWCFVVFGLVTIGLAIGALRHHHTDHMTA